jgi:hypothetical protein
MIADNESKLLGAAAKKREGLEIKERKKEEK